MQSTLITVAGSRRPITVNAKSLVVSIPPPVPDPSSSSSSSASSTTAFRRKPQVTFRSPSIQFPTELRVERSASRASSIVPATSTTSSTIIKNSGTSYGHTLSKASAVGHRFKYPMHPPLPVYHPLGRLALSLPEIDLETLGMRTPLPISVDDAARRSSSRARRPAAKLRDADVADGPVGSPLAGPADAPAEKPSPRKRRGAGQGAGAKRKRREPEDNDATYPAKRTRNTRQAAIASEGASPPGSVPPGAETPEVVENVEEVLKVVPERRSTRSRAANAAKPSATRRNSSASDATQTSVSVSIAAGRAKKDDADATPGKPKELEEPSPASRSSSEGKGKGKQDVDIPMLDAIVVSKAPSPTARPAPMAVDTPEHPPPLASALETSKEEGELSEEGELPSKA
ncbi:hypothetical protein FA95DRAFT_1556370 [Auriscalpium vulgare]|uniref:Uncharacterized protein n=1 Tax=Auriscalpium vulgare TaxID=40419 RepID=A0ACB8S1Y9_9AGAM|nr:hypothetical protein FA95DRAFT_1556370 [Auriscalpium vulgare]